MVETLQTVLESMLDRLYKYVTIYLPSLLAAVILFLGAYLMAVVARWVLYRIFKGPAIDKFLRQSGLAFMIDPSGRLRATRIVAETVYWCFLLSGFLLGLSVFDTDITTQITQNLVFLMPKLVMAGLILLAGAWLGHYLGRSMLVWAVNENIPGAAPPGGAGSHRRHVRGGRRSRRSTRLCPQRLPGRFHHSGGRRRAHREPGHRAERRNSTLFRTEEGSRRKRRAVPMEPSVIQELGT